MKRPLWSVAFWAAVLAPALSWSGAAYAPRVGQAHPDFVLPRIGDRQAVALSQFRGRKVLLIHFASW